MPRVGGSAHRTAAPRRGQPRQRERDFRNGSYTSQTVYSGTCTNSGTVNSFPTVTVTGPAGPTVYVTNATEAKTVTLNLTVPGGQSAVVDFGARTVILNGVTQTGVLATGSSWWDLQSGANSVQSNYPAQVTWRNAYS